MSQKVCKSNASCHPEKEFLSNQRESFGNGFFIIWDESLESTTNISSSFIFSYSLVITSRIIFVWSTDRIRYVQMIGIVRFPGKADFILLFLTAAFFFFFFFDCVVTNFDLRRT